MVRRMPISSAAFARTTLLLLFSGVAALVIIIVASLWLVERTTTYSDEVIQTQQLRARATNLLSLLQDAETGQRGYLLANDSAYLAPYEEARSRVAKALDDLRASLAQRGERAPALDRLSGLVKDKLDELAQTV